MKSFECNKSMKCSMTLINHTLAKKAQESLAPAMSLNIQLEISQLYCHFLS